ncbi:hypothetical protein KI387_019875 [Taxus chinensis]|uniref:C2H2-type domain-containing protein n=1 Tax=Taxus chinensis TaxID=29808 RepID=A0AA38G7U0_TAXCH|nr:hypothetical protein KI387_019875 [Taxus chinensis]
MEGKHISNHPHQHEQQQLAGIKTHHTKDLHDVWICNRCGWTYPNPHPSAKHRRKHRKNCGKIEGFKVMSSAGREIQGGSSDDELSDDEVNSTDHKKPSFHKDINSVFQANASAPTSDNTSSNLDMSSSEADVVEAAQKIGASDNATLGSSQTIVPDAKSSNFILSNESGKEALDEAGVTTVGLGVHGLNISRAIEPSKNSPGFDMLGFKHESSSFLMEVPDTDISQDASASIEHEEFPVKGRQALDYAKSKIQKNQTDNRVLPMPGNSIPPVVQSHPSYVDVVDSLGLHTVNETIKDHPKFFEEKQHISEDIKLSFAKSQNLGHIEPPRTFGISATTPRHAAIHHNLGISSRKVGIASILSFKETRSDDLKANFSSVEETPASTNKEIYEPSPTNQQLSESKTQEVSICETKEQEEQCDAADPSDSLEGSVSKKSLGAGRQKERLESQTEKLPQLASSAISIGSRSADNIHLQVTEDVLYSQEKCSTVAQGVSDKPEDNIGSKHISPINGDSESYREGEQPPDFDNTNSDDILSHEMDNKIETVLGSGLPEQDAVKETEVSCFKDVEKTPGQEIDLEASSEVVIPDQDMSCADGHPTEYSKAGKRQEAENSAFTDSNIIEHDMSGFNSDYEKEDYTEDISLSDVGMAKHSDANVIALEELPKTPASEVVVDEKSAESKSHQPECVDYSQEEKSTVIQDIFVKPDYIESTDISPSISGDSDSHGNEGKPQNSNHTTSDGMLYHEEDKEKIIGGVLSKQEAVKETEEICSKASETTSVQKLDAQASSVAIPDPEISYTHSPKTENSKAGERQVVECSAFTNSSIIEHEMKDYSPDCTKEDSTQGTVRLPEEDINSAAKVSALEMLPKTIINEVVDEKSAVSESHQPECTVCTDEKKSTVEQAVSVKPVDYIESKHISPINGHSDSHGDERPRNSNVTNTDDLDPEANEKMIIGTDLSKHESLNEANEPCSEGIETTLDQQLDFPTSGEMLIPDQGKIIGDALSKQEAVKETEEICSKASETTSVQKLDALASSVAIPDPEISYTDSPQTENSKAGERQVVECSAFTNSSIIEHEMKDYSPDCTKEDSTQGTVRLPEVDINSAAKVTALEMLPKTIINEVVDEKSAVSESHQLECTVCTDEKKSTVEQAVSVKLGDYIESKHISPINGHSDSRGDEKPQNSNVTNTDDLDPEADEKMIIGTDLSKHESLNEANEPCSEGIETTLDQQLDLPTSGEMLIPDQGKIIGDALSKKEMVKETEEICSKASETTSVQTLDAQASSVAIPDPEISYTDSPQTENSKGGKRQVVECSAVTNSSIIEHEMMDYSSDCTKEDSTQGTVRLPEVDINSAAKVTTLEMLPKTIINEVVDEKSAVSESHQLECTDCTDEKKSTVEQAVSVKPGYYIESKHISPINGHADSHGDEKPQNFNVTNTDDLDPEADEKMIIGTDLSKHESLNEANEPCSEGIETTLDQQLDFPTSGELLIPDQGMSLTDNPTIEDSKSGELQQVECSSFTNSSIIQHGFGYCDPDRLNKDSIQVNTVLPDVDKDKDLVANITPRENLPKAPPNEVVNQNSASVESVQPKARDTHLSFQGDDHGNSDAAFPGEESDHEGTEKGLEHSVMKQSDKLQVGKVFIDTSCSASITTEDSSLHLNGSTDNHENSSKEAIDDIHGSESELINSREPTLWEQLLETNANGSNNQETCQDLEKSGTSPGNRFNHENKLYSSEEVPQTFGIEGRHGLISEQFNNTSTGLESTLPPISNEVEQDPIISSGNKEGDVESIHSKEKTSETSLMVLENVFEAPPFMTLVKSGNHPERQFSHNEIQPKVKEKSDGEFSTNAEMGSGRHEKLHIPLRNLLAKENTRGTQDQSKLDPLFVHQHQTSSQKNIHEVHASAAEVIDQDGTSSQKLSLLQKHSNSYSQKLAEKVWNSPARLPIPKAEKQKTGKTKSPWTMCLCGSDVK